MPFCIQVYEKIIIYNIISIGKVSVSFDSKPRYGVRVKQKIIIYYDDCDVAREEVEEEEVEEKKKIS